MHCLPQRLKSTFFGKKIEWRVPSSRDIFQKTLILALEANQNGLFSAFDLIVLNYSKKFTNPKKAKKDLI